MRKAAMFLVVLMCAVTAGAADPGAGATQFSIFTSNLSYTESSATGSNVQGGVGLAISHAWTPRWSAELSVAAERHRDLYRLCDRCEVVAYEYRRFSALPIDLTTQYRFANDSRWTPYLNAGIRYVRAPVRWSPESQLGGFGFMFDRTSLEVGMGTALRLTPHFGLRFDAIRLLRSDSVSYDPLVRGSVGLSWKF